MGETRRGQLELVGLGESLRQTELLPPGAARRRQRGLETVSDILGRNPDRGELAFLHSGLCQTYLPHARPDRDDEIWTRSSGRFSMMVTPGGTPGRGGEAARYVGVPYGPKARLILIYLQSEGVKSRVVQLGSTLAGFIRAMGLEPIAGKRGSIAMVKEQLLRIGRCTFTLSWTGAGAEGDEAMMLQDVRIASGLELALDPKKWEGQVVLDADFHAHLKEHAVPLDWRAIRELSGNSMGLDLYTLFAYRLPRLERDLRLTWRQLSEQMGSDAEVKEVARRSRQALSQVLEVYPGARVEVTRTGLLMRRSPPSVPNARLVRGHVIVGGGKG